VHNDSEYEVSTDVTFWNIPGGVGTAGTLLDTQTVIIPASSSATVISSQPFINSGGHTCAVVSIDTADSPCQFDPAGSADSVHIPDPDANITHSCSAWRNTNTIFVFPGLPWHFEIGLGQLHADYAAAQIGIQLQVQHVPADFAQNDHVLQVIKAHRRIYSKTPPYLIPVLREKLPAADIKPIVKLVSKGDIAPQRTGNGYVLEFENSKETNFQVSGVVPANAKADDTFLVQLTAHYPKAGRFAAKSIGFLEILVVKNK
jgi:hypothetical protein